MSLFLHVCWTYWTDGGGRGVGASGGHPLFMGLPLGSSFGAATLIIMTFSIKTLSIEGLQVTFTTKGLLVTLSIKGLKCHSAEKLISDIQIK
jgi:hypothetical protein